MTISMPHAVQSNKFSSQRWQEAKCTEPKATSCCPTQEATMEKMTRSQVHEQPHSCQTQDVIEQMVNRSWACIQKKQRLSSGKATKGSPKYFSYWLNNNFCWSWKKVAYTLPCFPVMDPRLEKQPLRTLWISLPICLHMFHPVPLVIMNL